MAPEADADFAIHQLEETLRLLALPAASQVAALPNYVVVPDELALTWDDCVLTLDWMSSSGRLNSSVRPLLDELTSIFTRTTEDRCADFWSIDGLAHHPEWARVRALAQDAIERLGLERRLPTLDWITYVPGAQ